MNRAQLRGVSRSLGLLAFVVGFALVLVHGGIGGGTSGEGAHALTPQRAVPHLPGPRVTIPAGLAGPAASAGGQSSSFAGLPAVGTLFAPDDSSFEHHYCTASVVDSPGGDVIATAAHCLSDPAQGSPTPAPVVFVPGYHDGQQPYGAWHSTALLIDPGWASNSDPDADLAFVVVHKDGDPKARIQDLVGGERITFGAQRPATVGVVGYPGGGSRPIWCLNQLTVHSDTQSEFDCTGFTDGTSGGPLLRDIDPVTGLGTLLGVIGGYQEGGDSDDVSYAATLGARAQALYEQAVAAGTASAGTASASTSPSAAPSPSGS